MSTRRASKLQQQAYPSVQASEAPQIPNYDAIVPQQPNGHLVADMYNQKPHGMNHAGMVPMGANYPMYPPMGMEMPGYPYNLAGGYTVAGTPLGQREAVPNPASASRQNRKAQVQAKNQLKTQAAKRKAAAAAPPSLADTDHSDDSDDDDVPDGPSAADIAKHKYNHIEDEKERKKLKRLLRNRVSAQQARERKKAFLGKLETKCNDLEARSQELEQQVNKLERENFMLRQVVKNTTSKNAHAGEMKNTLRLRIA